MTAYAPKLLPWDPRSLVEHEERHGAAVRAALEKLDSDSAPREYTQVATWVFEGGPERAGLRVAWFWYRAKNEAPPRVTALVELREGFIVVGFAPTWGFGGVLEALRPVTVFHRTSRAIYERAMVEGRVAAIQREIHNWGIPAGWPM